MNNETDRLLKLIENEVAGRGYRGYDASMGYDITDDELLYDAGMAQFDPNWDSALGFNDRQSKAMGLSTYAIRVLYVDNSGLGNPVEVELFGTDFNTGIPLGQTLVFTNADGDNAIVSGRRVSFIAMQNRLRYSPFRIRYARIKPQDTDQFDNPWIYRFDSVWGGLKENDQTPEEYLTPEQFQLNRVDLPMGYSVDSEHRIIFDVNPTEAVGTGLNITFWIDKVEDPIQKLKGQPALKNMGGPGIQNQMPTPTTAQALQTLIKSNVQTNNAVRKIADMSGIKLLK